LDTIIKIVQFLKEIPEDHKEDELPTLILANCWGHIPFPRIVKAIDQIVDTYGKIKDNASPELLNIRRELAIQRRNL